MYPTKDEAKRLLSEAGTCNPGPWVDHSEVVARCAEQIADRCENLDKDKAYVLGLLHDIGRKFGIKHLGHVYDGYTYMTELGFSDVARVCVTHSFPTKKMEEFIGKNDITKEQQEELELYLGELEYDDYDRLIQLCDSIGAAEGVVSMEERMGDVKRRYGYYPQEKWDANFALKDYFSKKIGMDIYELLK